MRKFSGSSTVNTNICNNHDVEANKMHKTSVNNHFCNYNEMGKSYLTGCNNFYLIRKNEEDDSSSVMSDPGCGAQNHDCGAQNHDYSRKPIICPSMSCFKNVALASLTHHFLFDHPEVPVLCVEPGSKSTLTMPFSAFNRTTSKCLALLLVSGRIS